MLLAPPALVKGDTIYILSTARKITRDEIAAAVSAFEAWGLKVVIGKTVGLAEHQYAGTDKERLEDFQYALDNPEIKAVICARGGYGTVRIMDDIVYDRFMQSPKWIVGFSDITYLHTHISNTLGVQTIHSIMPVQFPTASAAAVETLRQTLFGEKTDYRLMPHELNRRGNCEGILIGGNLSILYSITGTKSGINTMGKILFLEDIDEYLYHIDRMMINLKRSGKLQGLAGIIAGSFTEIKDNAVPFGKDAFQIIAEHVHGFEYPVCFGFPAGHLKDNCALRIGKTYSLQVKDNEVLIT
jgi:muramoyltetrapeptide carboxypeptidase